MVTASVGLVLLCSAFPMELFLDFDARVLGGLPDGYLRAVPVLEGVVLVAGMIALLLAARRLTWLHAVASVLALAELVALVSTEESAALLVFIWVAVVVATAAAVAGERGRVWHRRWRLLPVSPCCTPLPVTAASSSPSASGALPLELNGGEIDYDGVPVFLTGPFSAVLPVLLYLAGWLPSIGLASPAAEVTRRRS